MSKPKRYWDGITVHVADVSAPGRDPRSIDISLKPEVASQLALLLRGSSSGLGSIFAPLPEGLTELMNALDYVLVADPASVAAHRRLDASKGMTPDGGYRTPENVLQDLGVLPRPVKREPSHVEMRRRPQETPEERRNRLDRLRIDLAEDNAIVAMPEEIAEASGTPTNETLRTFGLSRDAYEDLERRGQSPYGDDVP